MLVRMSSRPVALVTGPTAGLGRSFARELAARGHDLVLVARDEDRLRSLAGELEEQYGVSADVLVADLADRGQLALVEDRIAAAERPVDVLVNNAGFALRGSFVEHDVAEEQRLLDVLVVAVLRLSHAAARQMTARGGGVVLNVSSVAGFVPRGTYSAAKAWVTMFSRALDLEHRPLGVRAMAVCPGFVRTEFHARIGMDTRWIPGWMWLDADRVVRDALDDLDRGRRVSVPSRRYRVLVALARLTPERLIPRRR